MNELPNLVPRRAESLVREALNDTRVVLVNGARQAGKSTVTRLAVVPRPDAVIRLLDDPATLRAGQQTLPFGDKLRAIPLDAIWQLQP